MPVHNGGEHLYEAMASLLSQSFADFEIVAVDDGSTDDSAARLEAWCVDDGRVRLIRQEHAGIVAALERGRAEARGRYLARMDADDVAEPERLRRQLELMEAEPTLAGCGCGVRYSPADQVRDGARRYERWINAAVTPDEIEASIFVECPLAHPTFFMSAKAVQSVGGYRERGWPEDYDLVLRMWRAGASFGKVPDVLHRWREGPDRLSRAHASYTPGAFLDCKVHHLTATLLPEGRDAVIWGAGPVGKTLSRALDARGRKVAAFVELDPRKIGQEIHGAPVLDTESALRLRGPLHLPAVGQAGARTRITALLTDAGMLVLDDFVAVA
jgi:cellulose synthase/poly-beta-1,6-N-acetylglucosamine synthase-like glycosyltransferase